MDWERGTNSIVIGSDTSRLFSVGLYEEYGVGIPETSEEDVTVRVHGAIESLTRLPHLLGHVCEAQHRRFRRLCSNVGGTQVKTRL